MSTSPNPELPAEPDPAELRLVEKREHTLLSLIELSHELSVSFDLRQTADLVLLNLMGQLSSTRAAIWLVPEGENGRVVFVRAYGMTTRAAEALGPALASSLAERFASSLSPIHLDHIEPAAQTPATRRALEMGIEVVASVAAHGQMLGMLVLGSRVRRERYGSIETQYIGAAAGLAGTALENNRLYRQVLETNRQLRQANEHLIEIDALRTQLVQNVNHELRTPLAVILGYASTVTHDASLPELHRKALTAILEQSQRLKGLVENLLDFSASATGGLQVECIEGDVRSVVEEVAESRRAGVLNGMRGFECEVAAELPRVRFDPRRLAQAIHLLIDNAVKFTPPGSHIRLNAHTLRQYGRRWLAIDVEDDGPGIPREQLPRLFEPFRQGDGTTTRRAGGMGLGLALVAEILRRMGGEASALSGPGLGAQLRLTIPALEA